MGSRVKAADVMTPKDKLATAKKGDSIKTLATTMMEKNIRHIPLMNGDLCEGMLSIKDVVGEVLKMERDENEHLQDIVTDIYSHKHQLNIDAKKALAIKKKKEIIHLFMCYKIIVLYFSIVF